MTRMHLWAMGMSALLCGTSVAVADTLTWKSTITSGKFSDAANWTSDGSHTSPQPGDTCVFPSKEVTLESEEIELAEGTVMTIHAPSKLNVNTVFKGAGGLCKKGAGAWIACAGSTFSGGFEVLDGTLQWISSFKDSSPFGSGKITLRRTSSSSSLEPRLYFNASRTVTNEIEIVNGLIDTHGSIYVGSPSTCSGRVTSDSDFVSICWYRTLTYGEISAPGHTVTLKQNAYAGGAIACNSPINASVRTGCYIDSKRTQNVAAVTFKAANVGIDHTLTMGQYVTNTFTSAASWAGTNVVMETGSTALFQGSQNLSEDATLSIASDAKINIASDVKLRIAKFIIDGIEQPAGVYSSNNCPAIDGDGMICCGIGAADVLTWSGSTSGLFSDAANWTSTGSHTSPRPGDVCVFPSKTITLESEEVELTEGTVTTIHASSRLNVNTVFKGAGGLRKSGSGGWYAYATSTFSGGFEVLGGTVQWGMASVGANPHGFGKITIRRASLDSTSEPRLYYNSFNVSTTNEVEIINGLTDTYGSIYAGNSSVCSGRVTSDSDFVSICWYKTLTYGEISAPGHTVTLKQNAYSGGAIVCDGPINASVRTGCYLDTKRTQNVAAVTFNAANVGIDHTLTMGQYVTNTFTSAASWAGTNVVMETGSTALFQGSQNLSEDATLSIASDAKINIASGVRIRIAKFYIDGIEQPSGISTASNLPEVISGKGRLSVGPRRGFCVIFR